MVLKKFKQFLALTFIWMAASSAYGQINHEQLRTPDTLNVAERLQISTNFVDWAIQLPNISFEYDLGGVTWNRWALGAKLRGNWKTKHDYKPAQVWNLLEARGELRYYWRTRKISNEYPRHSNKLLQLFSCRRDSVKHPNTTYYRGVYVSAMRYSVLVTKHGYQGAALSAGFLYGIVKPLYQLASGNTIDLDLGISAGLYFTHYNKFRHDRESDCYENLEATNWHLIPFPLINELKVGLVYRFTNSPKHQLGQRYRWRYDVDEEFRDRITSSMKREKEIRDSVAKDLRNLNEVQRYFNRIYNENYNRILRQMQNNRQPAQKGNSPKAQATKKKKGGRS